MNRQLHLSRAIQRNDGPVFHDHKGFQPEPPNQLTQSKDIHMIANPKGGLSVRIWLPNL